MPTGNAQVLEQNLHEGVLHLTKQNAQSSYGISLRMREEMFAAFERAAADPQVKAVVVDAGGRGFHRGAVMVTELKPSLEDLDEADFRDLVDQGQSLGRLIAGLAKPVIGIARAGALGGGLELLLRSDFLFARDDAEFSFPEVTLGFVAAWGGTQWGGRLMSFRRAQEFLLLGEGISGRQAAMDGLVTRSFPTDEALDRHVAHVLERLASCSPHAFSGTKRCLSAIWEGPLAMGEEVEVESEVMALGSGDFLKAYNAWRTGKTYHFGAGRMMEKGDSPNSDGR